MVEEILAGTEKFLVDIVVQPTNRIYIYFDSDPASRSAIARKSVVPSKAT